MPTNALSGRYIGLAAAAAILSLSACSAHRDSGPSRPVNVSHIPDAVPRYEKRTRAGNPPSYVVMGKRYYVMKESIGYVERGLASWYGKKFHGRKTSNGETYNMYAMTAAHKTLPIPSYVQVTNLDNGKRILVRVNDRGPFHEGRIIDLSYTAAQKLDIVGHGTGRVEVRAIEAGQPIPAAPTRIAGGERQLQPATLAGAPATAKPSLYLQLGSFISMHNAETLRARLALNNVAGAAVRHTTVDRQNIYRVRVGPLPSVEEANRVAGQINSLGMGVPTIIID